MAQALLVELTTLLGTDNVLTDETERRFYSQDVYREGRLPLAVIRPGSTDELIAALRAIAREGLAVVPRGGGMSYTDGYLPQRENSISVDLLRLNRVLEVNVEDAYVTVEAAQPGSPCTRRSPRSVCARPTGARCRARRRRSAARCHRAACSSDRVATVRLPRA